MTVFTADVVIVGSGVAGAITGYTLARAGVKVLILEAGPRVDRGPQPSPRFHAVRPARAPNSP